MDYSKVGIVGFAMLVVSVSGADAQERFGVALGRVFSEREAVALREKFESETCKVFIRKQESQLGKSYQVLVGPFDSYMDAWATNRSLPTEFPTDRFIDKWGMESVQSDLPRASTPRLVPPIKLTAPSMRQVEPGEFVSVAIPALKPYAYSIEDGLDVSSLNREDKLSVGFLGKKNSHGVEALESFLREYPSDSFVNTAKIRLARRLMAQKRFADSEKLLGEVIVGGGAEERNKALLILAYVKNSTKGYHEGYAAFLAIAQDLALDGSVRSHALRMAAGSAHAAQEYTSSVLTFRQLENEAFSLPERREAKVQLCGIQMELVGRAKGNWGEVIASCDAICDDPEFEHEFKATANLMRFEAMFHAGYIEDALVECRKHLELFPDVRREFVSAVTWHGALLVHANQKEEAKKVLKRVLEMEIASKDKFGGHEPKARAAYWLAFIALQEANFSERDRYVDYLRTNFPKSPETNKISQMQPIPQ